MAITLKELVDFDAVGEFSIHPRQESIAYVAPSGDAPALWVRPLHHHAAPRLLWAGEPVERCVWRPDGARILVQTDPDGRENYRLGEIDPRTAALTWLTEHTDVRHEIGPPARTGNQPYSPDAKLLAYASNGRDRATFDIVLHDLADGRTWTVLEGDDRYFPVAFSPDGSQLLTIRMRQNTDHDLFTCDLGSGTVRRITPYDGPARYLPGSWSGDGQSVYVATTQGRDLAGLARIDLHGDPQLHWLATPPDDVDYVMRSGHRLLWVTNAHGYSSIHLRDLETGDEQTVATPAGAVLARDLGRGPFAPQSVGPGSIITGVGTATAPTELCLISTTGSALTRLTSCGGRVPPPDALVEPTVITYPSTDGVAVPALLYKPFCATADMPAPVVVSVHGGPEVQALPSYDPLTQYLLQRGIGVIAPNYRGSSGYGLAYQRMIYRDFAGGDLRDLAGAADYLRTVDWADAGRLGVYGESYGGFAVLSCISRLPGLWAAAVDHCGRSDLTTLAVPPHWRARMREWVGDPDDDAELLKARSPITHAEDIVTPLLVVHGAHDTRIPKSESDRIVERLRELDKTVEYLVLEGAGHSATSRRDAHTALEASAEWFVRHLLGPEPVVERAS